MVKNCLDNACILLKCIYIDDFINNNFAIEDIEENLIKRHQDWQQIDAQLVSEEGRLALDRRIHCIFYLMGANGMKVGNVDTVGRFHNKCDYRK